jgi:hypothetical protein
MEFFSEDKTYSTNDAICRGTGDVIDSESRVGGYCTLAPFTAGCSVVLGIADGGIGATRFSGKQLKSFLDRAKS